MNYQFEELARELPRYIEKEYNVTDPAGLVVLGILSEALKNQDYLLTLDCIRTLNLDLTNQEEG